MLGEGGVQYAGGELARMIDLGGFPVTLIITIRKLMRPQR